MRRFQAIFAVPFLLLTVSSAWTPQAAANSAMIVVVPEKSCWCTPTVKAPVVATAGCFSISKIAQTDAAKGWCDVVSDDCLLGPIGPRDCGSITVTYAITHGGQGCCGNTKGVVVGGAPANENVPVGLTRNVDVSFAAPGCGLKTPKNLEVHCTTAAGALNTKWTLEYECKQCTWAD